MAKSIKLKDENQNDIYVSSVALDSTSSVNGEIKFGVDANGNYGYIKVGADSVTPFRDYKRLKPYFWLQKDTTASQTFTIPSNTKVVMCTAGYGINSFNGTDSKMSGTINWFSKVGESVSYAGYGNVNTVTWTNQTTLTISRNGTSGTCIVICFAEE